MCLVTLAKEENAQNKNIKLKSDTADTRELRGWMEDDRNDDHEYSEEEYAVCCSFFTM